MNKVINLLSRNIHDIIYDDVVEFCKQKVLESTQLDYKRNIPKDLAKHFATFSNTQGGLIVIGVGEDDKGLPTTFDGVPNDGKLVDRIHQFAANVTPLPTYDVCTTNEQDGNVFILVRIDEGAATPYTTLNDPTVWIRTGNVSTPASREELLRLANKRRDAEAVRAANITFAEQYFAARVKEVEEERRQIIQAGKMGIYKYTLGSGETSAIFSLTIQPYYPNKQLTTPQDLLQRRQDYCGRAYFRSTFINNSPDTLPGGIAGFTWHKGNGHVRGEQLYANGVSNLIIDVLDFNSEVGTRTINLGLVGINLYCHLRLTQNYYKMVGYAGVIVCTISLSGGSGADVTPIGSGNFMYFPRNGKVRLSSYNWSYEIDTASLYDDSAFKQFFVKLIQDISWSLGIDDAPQAAIEAVLKVVE
ncbi:helix-turn-helix domain-containing protein [Ktedonobacter sp. SOSP1-85]|uniref:AlbA family DNA-binding domain-containing protein n=1 Tax=Ktedonobacter sp. SOSP1-85 TaxID=2778367 RepID=UPI001915990A|nr:ATP-binding protein [Ktedonobacter sp. SOSP1-85]